MPSVSRATTIRRDVIEREPDARTVYRPAAPAGKRGSKPRRAGEISLRDIHLTASVGVATLPEMATAPDRLIQAADMAMCRVKQSGRNGIQAAIAPTES
jgi:GGDEF domain-containing protein